MGRLVERCSGQLIAASADVALHVGPVMLNLLHKDSGFIQRTRLAQLFTQVNGMMNSDLECVEVAKGLMGQLIYLRGGVRQKLEGERVSTLLDSACRLRD